MKWATRSGCHVDRTACAWLIHKVIDLDAEFVFVDDPDGVPPPRPPSTSGESSCRTTTATAPSRPSSGSTTSQTRFCGS